MTERVVATADGVQVVIENKGNAPVVDASWVDVYVDLEPAPIAESELVYVPGFKGETVAIEALLE